MNVQDYTPLWNQISANVQELLTDLSQQVTSRGTGFVVADPVTLEIDSDEFFGSLLFRIPGVSIPAVAVSLTLTELEESDSVAMKLCLDTFKVGANGADFGDPVNNTFGAHAVSCEDVTAEELIRQANSLFGTFIFEQVWRNVNYWARLDGLQHELTRRASLGFVPVTIAVIEAELNKLGYRLDRMGDCKSVNRWMSGPMAGFNYSAINPSIVELDTGLSFAHVDARRDANFDKLQQLRMNESLFAVVRGHLFGL